MNRMRGNKFVHGSAGYPMSNGNHLIRADCESDCGSER